MKMDLNSFNGALNGFILFLVLILIGFSNISTDARAISLSIFLVAYFLLIKD